MLIPKIRDSYNKKLKKCQFPGCEIEEPMHGRGKYCHEHRKQKYHKQLYKKTGQTIESINQRIESKSVYTEVVTHICALDGCNNQFTIKVFPNQTIYPKYCELHRNEHRRKMFLKNQHNMNIHYV